MYNPSETSVNFATTEQTRIASISASQSPDLPIPAVTIKQHPSMPRVMAVCHGFGNLGFDPTSHLLWNYNVSSITSTWSRSPSNTFFSSSIRVTFAKSLTSTNYAAIAMPRYGFVHTYCVEERNKGSVVFARRKYNGTTETSRAYYLTVMIYGSSLKD